LTVPAAAQGTVTVGSDLGRAPNNEFGCGVCTVVQSQLGSDRAAANGIVSPVNGMVTVWRIRSAASGNNSAALRVVRPLPGAEFTAAGTAATVTPPASATTAYQAQLPIAIGDKLGLDLGSPSNYFVADSSARRDLFAPRLVDGAAGRPSGGFSAWEITINADIEPTASFSVKSLQRVKRGSLLITAELPNAGTLVGGDRRGARGSASAAKKRPKLLKRSAVTLSQPGSTQLQVFPTKAAKTALAHGKKVKAALRLSFTPSGGSSSTKVTKVKLRR
jgi:hypothetical protein